jgi:hypothetical protein
MSQIENAGTSSSKTKRVNRKRQPLSGAEKQKMFVPVKKKRIKQLMSLSINNLKMILSSCVKPQD